MLQINRMVYCLNIPINRLIYHYIIIIIIIIHFYGAYIRRNLSSETQQNRINKHNREQGRVIIRERDNRRFMVEMQFGMNRSLPKLSFVLGTISCEIDDLSCLGICGWL